MNRLTDSVSPYLLSHADNPVDWWPWTQAAFDEAKERDVPVIVSIGYATCHWCHVMARESFSDEAIAAVMRERFVSIKVDREEHPEVDSSYMAAAGAFTRGLGWPLTVFATPDGRPFFAATYCPPEPVRGHPSFRQVLDAVWEAWTGRRNAIDETAGRLAEALGQAAAGGDGGGEPTTLDFQAVVGELERHEDTRFGGFGDAPKFPVAPVILMLQRLGASTLLEPQPRQRADDLARRTLRAMAASPLRDAVEGGFFRYGTRRDWSEPHYERMLYDNALLLRSYAWAGETEVCVGIVDFLLGVLRRDGGAFGSAQDSESFVDGQRTEGGYYALSRDERRRQEPPKVDGKVLAGWNGLAIGALASAGERLGRPEWVDAAAATADYLLTRHVDSGRLIRASLDGRASDAPAVLEDYGMLAHGLLDLALASGRVRYAEAARDLVDRLADADGLTVPGGGDPILAAQGIGVALDPSEGAYPSGISQMASAALTLYELTGELRYRKLAERAVEPLANLAVSQTVSMGGTLAVLADLRAPSRELVVVTDDRTDPLATLAYAARGVTITAVLSTEQAQEFAAAGFSLFEGREGPAAYLCEERVCSLPAKTADALMSVLERPGIR